MKEKKGVTLIALVITIIIIMILSSIAIYSGASTIRYVNFNKAKSEIQVIQSYVNQWYKEYQEAEDKNIFLGDYGELIETAIENDKCTQEQIDNAFAEGGITDDNKKSNYKFFSASFLKEKIGLDASFDYLISIKDRNTILYNGVIYNKKPYYILEDFGIQNINQISPSSIEFELEQGENTDIVISNLQLGYGNNKHVDISKFIVEYSKSGENIWNDITKDVKKFEDGGEGNKTTKYKFSVDGFGEYYVRVRTSDKKLEDVEDINLEVRLGIKVGDYITYTSPTENVSLSTAETGYTSEQTLPAKDTFRVMDIDSRGNMTLIGAMTSSDPTIYFRGALGYNNAVYTLNKKCSDLYKDTSKGIIARSIKIEDITERIIEGIKGETIETSTGRKKFEKYQDEQMAKLELSSNVSKNTSNKTITYSNNHRNYPHIFQFEAGGKIGNVDTSGEIGQSDSYNGYNGLTELANATPMPESLTIPFSYYCVEVNPEDFNDIENNQSVFYSIFLGEGKNYWIASRCTDGCSWDAHFRLRNVYELMIGDNRINQEDMEYNHLYDSDNMVFSNKYCICPIVTIPGNIKITVSKDESEFHKESPHEVQ